MEVLVPRDGRPVEYGFRGLFPVAP